MYNLHSSKRQGKIPDMKIGGVAGIILFNKERHAFLGGASGHVLLVDLRKMEIMKKWEIKASVYCFDLNEDSLVIGGSNQSFTYIQMSDIQSLIDEEENK